MRRVYVRMLDADTTPAYVLAEPTVGPPDGLEWVGHWTVHCAGSDVIRWGPDGASTVERWTLWVRTAGRPASGRAPECEVHGPGLLASTEYP